MSAMLETIRVHLGCLQRRKPESGNLFPKVNQKRELDGFSIVKGMSCRRQKLMTSAENRYKTLAAATLAVLSCQGAQAVRLLIAPQRGRIPPAPAIPVDSHCMTSCWCRLCKFAQLISWDVHERYIDTLFKYVTRPAQPGYRKVSLRQVLRADKPFAKLAEQGENIRADNGKLPLDIATQSVLQEYELLVALLPLPETEGKGKKGKSKAFGRPERYEPYSPEFGKGYRNVPWKGVEGTGTAKGGLIKAEWLPKKLRYQEALAWNKRGRRVCFQLGQCSDPIARRAITIASYSHVGVTTRSRSAP